MKEKIIELLKIAGCVPIGVVAGILTQAFVTWIVPLMLTMRPLALDDDSPAGRLAGVILGAVAGGWAIIAAARFVLNEKDTDAGLAAYFVGLVMSLFTAFFAIRRGDWVAVIGVVAFNFGMWKTVLSRRTAA